LSQESNPKWHIRRWTFFKSKKYGYNQYVIEASHAYQELAKELLITKFEKKNKHKECSERKEVNWGEQAVELDREEKKCFSQTI
jgi:hypothetical protein